MAKTFKRIAALATAIAIIVCFAVSASAINVATITQYASTQDKVNVTVNVTDAPIDAAYVTYYAHKAGTPVYVDQVELNSGSATIQYQTDATDLKGTVKVGYTGNTGSAETKTIDGKTITCNGAEVKVIPTETSDATVTIAYTATDNMKFKTVTADANATVSSATESAGTITVALTSITGDVVLTIVEEAATAPDANVMFLDAAIVKVAEDKEASDYNVVEKAGNRKLTAIGKFTGSATEYGIAVSKEAITAENIASVATLYPALGANATGVFAVQLIDEGEDVQDALIASGTNYYVAIYAKVAEGVYVVDAASETVAVSELN